MRKFLFLLIALLAGVSGAWATDYTIHYKVKSAGAADPNGTFYNDGTANTNAWSNAWVAKKSTDNSMGGLVIRSSEGSNSGKSLSGWNAYLLNGVFEIEAPVGYQIKSYTIKAKRYDEDGTYEKTITPAGGVATTLNTSTDETIEVTGVNAKSTTFTVGGSTTSSSRVIVSDLAVTVENVAGSTYMIQYKDTKQFIANDFVNRTKNIAYMTITATGFVDLDGNPTYKIKNPSAQYAVYDEAAQSTKADGTGTGNKIRLSWSETDAMNTYTITAANVTNNYVRIKPAKTDEEQNLTNTYWTSWNTGEGNNIVFWGATDNLSNWLLVPASPITDLANLSNNKCYYIRAIDLVNNRGFFTINSGATYVTVSANGSTNYTKKKFAIIKKDTNYYLYSVDEGKFVIPAKESFTGGDVATSLSYASGSAVVIEKNDGTISTGSGVSDQVGSQTDRWKLSWSGSSFYFNISSSELKVYENGGTPDGGTLFDILEAGDFDPTEALNRLNKKSVTYIVSYGGEEKDRETFSASYGSASEQFPASLQRGGVDYTFSPTTIGGSTTEVNVTATWNAPFEISTSYATAKWYMVDMHSSENKYTWQYESSNEQIYTPVIGVTEFTKISDKNLWCFVGNPYDGFKIYNKAAGSTKTLRKATTGNTVSEMSTTDDHNLFDLYESSNIDGAYCFKLDDDTHYLNKQTNGGVNKLCGWNKTDNGSSCRFFASGKYYYDALTPLVLDAPVGSVGTKAGITTTDGRDALKALRTSLESDIFAMPGGLYPYAGVNPIIDAVVNSDLIVLSTGYYRIENADPRFVANQSKIPAIYYDSSADRLKWSIDGLTSDYQVNNIIKLGAGSTDGKYTIYSPNAQKYLYTTQTAYGKDLGTLGASGNDISFTSLGSAQFNIYASGNVWAFHANSHGSGNGSGGTIVGYPGSENSPSAWYIVQVKTYSLPMNDGKDGNYYATLCLPFDVTISGANAYTLAKSGSYLVPTAVTDNKVPAGTPVLLKGTSATATATINTGDAFNSGSPLDCALAGTYTAVNSFNGATHYVLGIDDGIVGFYHWDGTTLAANRAYLAGAGVKGYTIRWDDANEVTSVEDVQPAETAIYNLAGLRLKTLQKGVNLVNGKAIIVK